MNPSQTARNIIMRSSELTYLSTNRSGCDEVVFVARNQSIPRFRSFDISNPTGAVGALIDLNWQSAVPTFLVRGTHPNPEVQRETDFPSVNERIIELWALSHREAICIGKLNLDQAAVADIETATDLLVHYLKRDRIAGIVRRSSQAMNGKMLVELLLEGNTTELLHVCREMFKFDNVQD